MASKHKDITGLQSGRLTAVRYLGDSIWKCHCECGGTKNVHMTSLQRNTTTSCGCVHGLTTHGYTGTRTYESWCHMHQRCYNPKARQYKWYGGKGITVAERWNSFDNFLSDMGERPKGMSLDRLDPHKNYTPENCRWHPINSGRKCNTPMIGTQTVAEYATANGLKYHTAYQRWKKNKI